MAATPSRLVSSGFYRIHLYVVLGISVLALATCFTSPQFFLWPALAATVLSYVGSILWLVEKSKAGTVVLLLISVISLIGAWLTRPVEDNSLSTLSQVLDWLTPPLAGLVLGTTLAAMLLGHWYLNSPGMQLAPLRRLVRMMATTVIVRMILSGVSLALYIAHHGQPNFDQILLLLLRWLAGFVGVLILTWMTWQTLKIPNTQSATGILYIAFLGVLAGELTAQLLSI